MSHRNFAIFLAALGLASVACSTQSPLAPGPPGDEVPRPSVMPASTGRTSADTFTALHAAGTVPGSYELFFLSSGQIVPTLPVCGPSSCQELTLRAHVESSVGPADRGAVTFQYCSFRGGPPNDITRPDEAPSSACEVDGTARWANLLSMKVNESGDASMNFGFVRIPRTVGFRFRYSPQGGEIASGVSAAEDFTWTAQ
jgi:hypothetical protein